LDSANDFRTFRLIWHLWGSRNRIGCPIFCHLGKGVL
jgi:hypothetical protein